MYNKNRDRAIGEKITWNWFEMGGVGLMGCILFFFIIHGIVYYVQQT
eukprot:SAG11_NODE_14413_length_613_cov_0.684825_1_plen_46_part_01